MWTAIGELIAILGGGFILWALASTFWDEAQILIVAHWLKKHHKHLVDDQ